MPFHSALQLTPEIVFLIFVLFIFLVSRAMKVFIKAIMVAAAGFIFPWAAQYLGVGIGFAATIENGIIFAAAAVGLFFIYNFAHIVFAALKIITWPMRKLLNMSKENEIRNLKKEVSEIEKEKRRQK